ncbi:MAG: hypothetical protein IJK91_03450, partial [Bacteroidales bacterium]|nr:hypothetical protein [Bacteroidales bacterium]
SRKITIRAYVRYRLVARLCPFSEGPMTHIRPLQFGEFADGVYNGQRGELGLDQTIAPIVERLKPLSY